MAQGAIKVRFRGRVYNSPRRAYAALTARIDKNWDQSVQTVRTELKMYMDAVIERLRDRHGSSWPGGTSDKTLSKRTGELLEELSNSERIMGAKLDNLQGVFHLGEKLVFHEYGGTKTAGGKMMTIPLPAALDSRGVPLRKSARDWSNTFVAETRAGNVVIFQRRGGSIVPLYVLKDSVTVKPRLGFREEVANGIPRFVGRMADKLIQQLSS